MIKNIVFDLGNVLISFKPAEYLDKFGYPEEYKNLVIGEIFKSREWHLLDNGDLTIKEAIENIASRSSLNRDEIAAVFNLRTKIMFPLKQNLKLLPGLKKRGFRLYYLSNFPEDIFEEVVDKCDFFNLFDGGIISSRVNATKPDPKIYSIFLEKFSLAAGECLFIDDLKENVVSAQSMGMKGIIYDGSRELKGLIEERLNQGI